MFVFANLEQSGTEGLASPSTLNCPLTTIFILLYTCKKAWDRVLFPLRILIGINVCMHLLLRSIDKCDVNSALYSCHCSSDSCCCPYSELEQILIKISLHGLSSFCELPNIYRHAFPTFDHCMCMTQGCVLPLHTHSHSYYTPTRSLEHLGALVHY